MFGRRQVGISSADIKAMGDIMGSVMEIKGEALALKAENKALREDRDTWKALALKLSGQSAPPTARGQHE